MSIKKIDKQKEEITEIQKQRKRLIKLFLVIVNLLKEVSEIR